MLWVDQALLHMLFVCGGAQALERRHQVLPGTCRVGGMHQHRYRLLPVGQALWIVCGVRLFGLFGLGYSSDGASGARARE